MYSKREPAHRRVVEKRERKTAGEYRVDGACLVKEKKCYVNKYLKRVDGPGYMFDNKNNNYQGNHETT